MTTDQLSNPSVHVSLRTYESPDPLSPCHKVSHFLDPLTLPILRTYLLNGPIQHISVPMLCSGVAKGGGQGDRCPRAPDDRAEKKLRGAKRGNHVCRIGAEPESFLANSHTHVMYTVAHQTNNIKFDYNSYLSHITVKIQNTHISKPFLACQNALLPSALAKDGNVFRTVCLFVCLFVCLLVCRITQKVFEIQHSNFQGREI